MSSYPIKHKHRINRLSVKNIFIEPNKQEKFVKNVRMVYKKLIITGRK